MFSVLNYRLENSLG